MTASSSQKDQTILPLRPCVGIVVFSQTGKVWAGRRLVGKNDEMSGATKLWQFPQGGIDKGEEPYEAALRELWEETGMETVEFLAENADWITYDLPPELVGVALKGKYRGQIQKWFAFRFKGDESEIKINPPPAGNHAEFDMWAWQDLRDMPEMVVPFKRAVYEQVVAAFAKIN